MGLLEMVTEIVASHAASTTMTKEELVKELQDVYAALAALEKAKLFRRAPSRLLKKAWSARPMSRSRSARMPSSA